MAKKSTVSPAVEAEHLRLKDEMVVRIVDKIGGPLGDTDKTLVELAVFNTLGDLGITLPVKAQAVDNEPVEKILAGAMLAIAPFTGIPDKFFDNLILDKSHSESSIVSLEDHGGLVVTKPMARMILSFRMAIAEHEK